jgi:hypothetical protein
MINGMDKSFRCLKARADSVERFLFGTCHRKVMALEALDLGKMAAHFNGPPR